MIKIIDFPDYSVTADGRVWSHLSGRYLSTTPRPDGYVRISLRKDGHTHQRDVHRLVAAAFIPNPHNLPNVCHRDDDPTNNSVSNLFWGTQRDNMADMTAKGRRSHKGAAGESNNKAKLTAAQVSDIRGRQRYQGLYDDLSREFGINPKQISAIYRGKAWKHLP
jgi:hypothetical protein